MSQHETKFPRHDGTNEPRPAARQTDEAPVAGPDARKQSPRPLADVARKTLRRSTAELEYERMCGRFANTLAGIVLAVGVMLFAVTAASAKTITVTGSGDVIGVDGLLTLREAIIAANTNAPSGDAPAGDPGMDKIVFNINSNSAIQTIHLTGPLPIITEPLVIDGYTQRPCASNPAPCSKEAKYVQGSDAVLLIEIEGSGAGPSANGLIIEAADCTVRGLVINRFAKSQIMISGPIATRAIIEGNFIGLNAAGTAGFLKGEIGILINHSSLNHIGGPAPGKRNVISGITSCVGCNSRVGVFVVGPANFNAIQGNTIGMDALGNVAVGNGAGILLDNADGNLIGGDIAFAGNHIAGNYGYGISLLNSDTVVVTGNHIGASLTGQPSTGNGDAGLNIDVGSTGTEVGTPLFYGRNYFDGNNGPGIQIRNGSNNARLRNNYIGIMEGNRGDGLWIDKSSGNKIGGTDAGEANSMYRNDGSGIEITNANSFGNSIRGNYISSNGKLAIDLNGDGVTPNDNGVNDQDSGPNFQQNYPVITSATSVGGVTTIQGTLDSFLAKVYIIEFFANTEKDPSGYGEAQKPIGTTQVTINPGTTSFTATLPVDTVGEFITATATEDSTNNTSELSAAVLSVGPIDMTIGNGFVTEGNSGQTQMIFTVSLFKLAFQDVTVNYATADGTATAPDDYTAVSGVLTIPAGSAQGKIAVPINNDLMFEPNETFTLNLSNPQGATFVIKSQGTGTIKDNDPQPTITVNDIEFGEGNSGNTPFNFSISLSNPSYQPITVQYATADGTATAGSDYQAANATFTFQPGQPFQNVPLSVNVVGDTVIESKETFLLNLSNPVNATIARAQGVGTIVDDDAAAGPTIQFSQATYAAAEQLSAMTVMVTRSGDASAAASVDYATSDGSAVQKGDFEYAAGILNFAPGEVSKTFIVLLNQDSHLEGPENFSLVLTNPAGAALGAQKVALVMLSDDLSEPALNAIDDTQTFVATHYHDFLNREPDAAGLAFWTNQISSCGSDAQCIEARRINVSAAFFLSIEFQETGYLRYLMEKESFGTMPKYADFMRDVQQLGRDVIVNEPGWEQKLKDNQDQFAEQWASRPAFKAQYDGMSNTEYVNALYANAGLPVSQADQQSLVNALDSSNQTRAAVLLEVARNATFRQNEQSPAFVMMEYFGYLRRDPSATPDSDLSGYNFWLNKLNAFGGNYIKAEMVKAFITSSEYRQRFGQ